jgi:hypothetical protein
LNAVPVQAGRPTPQARPTEGEFHGYAQHLAHFDSGRGERGKISDLMGDVARGIKAFRSGLNDTEQVPLQSGAIVPEQE